MKAQAAVVALIVGVSFAAPAAGQDFQLVGYSTAKTGGAGVLAFDEECAKVKAGARACTTADLISGPFATRPPDPNPNYTNWVLPSFVSVVSTSTGLVAVDVTGRTGTPQNLSCDGWTSGLGTVTGLTLSDVGRFALAACNSSRNIACCAPPPTPAPAP
jgi:hypothetical protein